MAFLFGLLSNERLLSVAHDHWMESHEPASLDAAFAPLMARFGHGLGFGGDGRRVRWTFDGQSAVVDLGSSGRVDACFVERPQIDAVTSKPCAAVYRKPGSGYALTPAGCSRLAEDLADFFSGVREPLFEFADAVSFEG